MRKNHPNEIIKLVISTCEQFKKDSYKYAEYILAVIWFKYQIDNLREVKGFDELVKTKNSRQVIPKLDKMMINNGLSVDAVSKDLSQSFQEQGGIIISTLLANIEINNFSFSEEKLGAKDTMKEAFSFLIHFFAKSLNGKEKNFYMPDAIRKLIKEIIDIKNVDIVYDVACGSGELLHDLGEMFPKASLYGQENREDVCILGKINNLVNRASKDNNKESYIFSSRDRINDKGLVQADLIVGNLLFPADGNRGAERIFFEDKSLGARYANIKGEYALIVQALQCLKDNGQAILVVPHGVLFRGGGDQVIREKMIDLNLIESVIGLPGQMFYGIENAPCILVLRKNKKDTDVLFVDASKECKDYEGINKIDSKDIAKLGSVIKEKKNQEGYSYKAPLQEIKSNQYNLNIGRYITSVANEEENITTIVNQIIQIEDKLNDLKIKTDLLMQRA